MKNNQVLEKIKDFGYIQVEDRNIEENGGMLFMHIPTGLESLGKIELRYWKIHPRISITINSKQVYESGITTDELLLKFMEDTHNGWQEK